jgi:hypothetical protein
MKTVGKICLFHQLAVLCLVVALAGCDSGPENIGKVSGKVTLDGQPLPDAIVQFTTKDKTSTSAGTTDTNGNYTLYYVADIQGAEIGEHTVSITTFKSGDPSGDPPIPRVPEKVPAKYNMKTELTATVKAGRNSQDFELKSDGSIIEPDGGEKKKKRK